MSKTIKKKTYSKSFKKVASGEKTYELRLADWDCQPGDILELIEINDQTRELTGRTLKFKVGHISKTKDLDNWWTQEEIKQHGFQVISLLKEDSLPQVRIKDAWLLRENASRYLHELWGENREMASNERMGQIVDGYREAWRPLEKQILQGITETLGLTFRHNVIDVYIAPWFYAFSDPMVIGVIHKPDVFVDVLTHELLHRLLTDNNTVSHDINMAKEWSRLFGGQHSFKTVVHIPVHAVHKAIYIDVLDSPARLERDIAKCKENGAEAYVEAWDYIEKHGYKEIIAKLRQSYEELSVKKANS